MLTRHHKNGFKIDWSLVVVGVMTATLFAASMIRSSAAGFGPDSHENLGGLYTLPPDVRVIAVQDFSLNTTGWSIAQAENLDPGFGPILGRFTDDAVSREFRLPAEAETAEISFDLHAIDDWQLESVIITVNGTEVMERSFSTRPALVSQQEIIVPDSVGITATPRTRVAGAPVGFAALGPETDDQSVEITIVIDNPGDALLLSITSTLAGPVFTASWAIDNLRVIAKMPPQDETS